jgi:hypothetical protein
MFVTKSLKTKNCSVFQRMYKYKICCHLHYGKLFSAKKRICRKRRIKINITFITLISKISMNVLGLAFNGKIQWGVQVSNYITKATKYFMSFGSFANSSIKKAQPTPHQQFLLCYILQL